MEAGQGAQTKEDIRNMRLINNMSRHISAMKIEISWHWTVFGRNS